MQALTRAAIVRMRIYAGRTKTKRQTNEKVGIFCEIVFVSVHRYGRKSKQPQGKPDVSLRFYNSKLRRAEDAFLGSRLGQR